MAKLKDIVLASVAALSIAAALPSNANAQAQYNPHRKHAQYSGVVQDRSLWGRFKNFFSNTQVDTLSRRRQRPSYRCTDNSIPMIVEQTEADGTVSETELTSSRSLFYYDVEGDERFRVVSPGHAVHVISSPTAQRVVHGNTISSQELHAVLEQYLDAQSTIQFKAVNPANRADCRLVTLEFGPQYRTPQHTEQPAAQPAPQPAAQPAPQPAPQHVDTTHNHVTLTDTTRKHVEIADTTRNEYIQTTEVYRDVEHGYGVMPYAVYPQPIFVRPFFIRPFFRRPFAGPFFGRPYWGQPYFGPHGGVAQFGPRYEAPRMSGRQNGPAYRPRMAIPGRTAHPR